MSEEIFDVVDDRDRVIGKQIRREVHRLGLKHRAVHLLVFNTRGEVYLQKRSFRKDTFPGAWDSSASGHLDSGETYDACAIREAREEIGLFLEKTPKRLFKLGACAATGQEFVWVYRTDSNGPFRLNLDELECGAFFKPDHVNRWMAERPRDFADAFRLVWKCVLNPAEAERAAPEAAKPRPAKPKPAQAKPAKVKATKPKPAKAKVAKAKVAKKPAAAKSAKPQPRRPVAKPASRKPTPRRPAKKTSR